MANTISPNMNLVIPGVGTEAGPTYAFDINASLTLVDQHDHSPGKGVQITTSGLNINSDLSLNGFSLVDATTLVFLASTTASTTPMSLSVAPGGESPQQQDLWYTPDTGVPIQITKNGIVNTVASSIPGESYAAGTFFWTQTQDGFPTTPANFDIGSITIRPNTALTTFGVVLQPSSSISSQYSISLPLLPTSQKIMTLDASGNMSAPYTVDGSTIVIVGNVIQVPAGGITNTQIALHTITGNRLVDHTIGPDQLAAGFDGSWNQTDYTVSAPQAFNVRVATTVNGTMSTAFDNLSVVDGVTLATGDLILIKNQTVQSDNGVYVVAASGTPARSTSYDTFTELNYAGVHVTAGTTNAGQDWFQNNVLTALTDAQSWSQSQTYSFTVPTGVNVLFFDMVGGGGGGGSGSVNSGGSSSQGGGGGAGAQPIQFALKVTPGDILAFTVGNKGKGGVKATTNIGIAGSSGGDSYVKGTAAGNVKYYYTPGASGGSGGNGNVGSAVPLGATTYANNNTLNGLTAVSPGGNAGVGGLNDGSPGGATVINFNAAAGGLHFSASPSNNRPAPGGGGGSGMGIGGAGGDGVNAIPTTFNNGGNAPATSYGAGGGGSSGTFSTAPSAGPVGGDGAPGVIRVKWTGAPS